MFMQMVFLNINTWILYDNESVLIMVYLYEILNRDCETRFTSYRIWVGSSVPPLWYNSKRHIFYFPFRTNNGLYSEPNTLSSLCPHLGSLASITLLLHPTTGKGAFTHSFSPILSPSRKLLLLRTQSSNSLLYVCFLVLEGIFQ